MISVNNNAMKTSRRLLAFAAVVLSPFFLHALHAEELPAKAPHTPITPAMLAESSDVELTIGVAIIPDQREDADVSVDVLSIEITANDGGPL